ncbi:MAG: Rieske (2Fe-2S) protein [Armatimonadetes bacterium]|nr:Rieske (2Fe-2S) protein [Armatimonadota bacterium]
MNSPMEGFIHAGKLEDIRQKCCTVVNEKGHHIAVFYHEGQVYAVDNRCPHMGFPLSRGSVKDGILMCHWHHARFDLKTGGTFDPFADDVRAFAVEVRDGEVWIDITRQADPVAYQFTRLSEGLEQNISLVMAKAAIALLESGIEPSEPFRIGLEFGTRYRTAWAQGLTMHVCFMNMLPYLSPEDKPHALFHGLSAVGNDTAGMQPNFLARPLPGDPADADTLKRWFRQFVEVRDSQGAERCLISALSGDATHTQVADMLFAAATDHRYLSTGHSLDFTNKALEALDHAGWNYAPAVLASLIPNLTGASRAEESNQWRSPIDLVAILKAAFEKIPAALASGASAASPWQGRDDLIPVLLGEDPQAIADSLLSAIEAGAAPVDLACAAAYAAALRVARFHTSNEFGDWDTSLHTFTFAQAVHQGMRRAPSPELLRGVFDAAMSIYLDRFLNMPPARLPEIVPNQENPDDLLDAFSDLLDRQQQVNEAAQLAARFLGSGGPPERLMAALGRSLLREDRSFHTIQMMEGAFRQYALLRSTPAGAHVLIAAARYLAAHAPTMRSQRQTYMMAWRLHRGERVYEEA